MLYSQCFLRTASAVQPIGPPSQGQEIAKFRNHCERHCRRSNVFSKLVDEINGSVAKEFRAFQNVADPLRVKPHQPRTGCISGYRIVRQDDLS